MSTTVYAARTFSTSSSFSRNPSQHNPSQTVLCMQQEAWYPYPDAFQVLLQAVQHDCKRRMTTLSYLCPCRRNTYNGLLYKEDPTIFAWDLLNEPRQTQGDYQAVQKWIDLFAPFIKSQDPNHMV